MLVTPRLDVPFSLFTYETLIVKYKRIMKACLTEILRGSHAPA